MLYALRAPVAFLALLAGFLLGVVAFRLASEVVARRVHLGGSYPRGTVLRRALDPFGAIAAALAGTGWGAPVEVSVWQRRRRGGAALALLAGPVANLLLGSGLLLAYRLAGGAPIADSLRDLLHGQLPGGGLLIVPALVGVQNLAMGLLGLVPIPPLPAGRVLFLYAPTSAGWQRAAHYLNDQHWGVAALLLLLLLPVAGEAPLLLVLLDLVGVPLVAALTA